MNFLRRKKDDRETDDVSDTASSGDEYTHTVAERDPWLVFFESGVGAPERSKKKTARKMVARKKHRIETASFNLKHEGDFSCSITYGGFSRSGKLRPYNQDYILSTPVEVGSTEKKRQLGMLFCILDGHGPEGEEASSFVADVFPKYLMDSPDIYKKPEKSLRGCFRASDEDLHSTHLPMAISGTAAVAAYVRGPDFFVANVGNCRAVLIQRIGEGRAATFHAVPLTREHTPQVDTERARIIRHGGRVVTIPKAVLGKATRLRWSRGDPEMPGADDGTERVWHAYHAAPGCRFTRSLGDSLARTIGVTAVPDVYQYTIDASFVALVLGSEGLFQHLPLEAIASTCAKATNPTATAEALAKMAKERCRRSNIPDISALVVNFENVVSSVAPAPIVPNPLPEEEVETPASGAQPEVADTTKEGAEKPVERALTTRATRVLGHGSRRIGYEGAAVGAADDDDDDDDYRAGRRGSVSSPSAGKGDGGGQTNDLMMNALREGFLHTARREHQFDDHDWMKDHELWDIFNLMNPEDFVPGDTVIKQGDIGNKFYIVETGEFDVFVDGEKTNSMRAGNFFGELALLYDIPRTATIKATANARCWSLERDACWRLVNALKDKRATEKMNFLSSVPLLKEHLTREQLGKLCDAVEEEEFAKGDKIVEEGQAGDKFYIIESGKCVVTKKNSKSVRWVDQEAEPQVLRFLRKYDYFGELALMSGSIVRTATVEAASKKVECLTLSAEKFTSILGPLQRIMDRAFAIKALKKVNPFLGMHVRYLTDAVAQMEELTHRSSVTNARAHNAVAAETDSGDTPRREVEKLEPVILKQGEETNCVYVVLEGRVNFVHRSSPNSTGFEVGHVSAGECFGDLCFLQQCALPFEVSTDEEDVRILRLDRSSFDENVGKLDEIMERSTLLSSLGSLVPELQTLNKEKTDRICEETEFRTIDVGEVIQRKYQEGPFIVVTSGRLQVGKKTASPGECVGSLVDANSHRHDVSALTTSRCAFLSQNKLEEIVGALANLISTGEEA